MSAHRTAATIRFGVLLAILCTAGAAAESDHEPPDPEKLPDPLAVDGDNPFIYVNDQSTDNYNAELALGLANRGRIDLRGFLVGYPREAWRSSEQDREQYREAKEEFVTHHRRVREMAERSGLQNPPPAELGVFKHHARPESGRIEDTEPIGSPGTERIVREARKASREEPLVIVAGGDLCTIADAYLTAPSIAGSVVVYWHEQEDDINLQDGYNIQNSGWSACIVLSRLATVLDNHRGSPRIEKQRVERSIPDPLRTYMLSKKHWKYGNPLRDGVKHSGDDKALLLAAFPETRGETRYLRVMGRQPAKWFDGAEVLPTIAPSEGRSHLVQIRETRGATEAWWKAWE
jgi:hypothetical protein